MKAFVHHIIDDVQRPKRRPLASGSRTKVMRPRWLESIGTGAGAHANGGFSHTYT